MAENILDDVRNELEKDFRHPFVGYSLLSIGTGVGVLATGELLSGFGASAFLVFMGIAIAGGVCSASTYYVLRKLGC